MCLPAKGWDFHTLVRCGLPISDFRGDFGVPNYTMQQFFVAETVFA